MSISFKYTTSLADYAHFDQALMNYLTAGDVNRNKQFSDQVYGFIFMLVFLIVAGIIAAIVHVNFSIFSFALGIVFYIFITRYRVKQIKNRVTPKRDCSLFGEHEMTLEDQAFTVKAPGLVTTTNWNVVTDVQEDDGYFFIFLDSLRGVYIPKRELESEDLVKAIRMYLSERIG